MKPKSKRPKAEPRRILLSGERQREEAMKALRAAPLDAIRPLECLIREEPKKRGLDQNAYYWHMLGEASEQCWQNQRQYPSDVWHEYCRRNVMADEIITKDGERRSKWIEMPDGSTTVISTTQLEKGCFAEYTTTCEAFFANMGVRFSVNPRDLPNA